MTLVSGRIIKAAILIGGPAKGTRFRPLSLELPKPLFPIGGFPMIYHHIEIPNLAEIILIGFYQPQEALTKLITDAQNDFNVHIRYLQEFAPLGTAGGVYQFRDQIMAGGLDLLFVMNADVCCDAPLEEMLEFHKTLGLGDRFVILSTEATREQSMQFGCIVEKPETNEVLHYVEKPATFVSTNINCGIYLFTPGIFNLDLRSACKESIQLETEIFQPLAGSGTLYAYSTNRFWSQIKHAAAVIYANRQVLAMYRRTHPQRLDGDSCDGPRIIGDVCLHQTSKVDKTAVLGPNVSVGPGAVVGAGVRLRDCIVLRNAEIRAHACCLNSVIGWNAVVGEWARVEGTAHDPNPNTPFTKLEVVPVFNSKGQLNPSITVIGSNVEVPPEVIILNSIVLPHKELSGSFKNQIIL
ncbi:unnamed protein product [Schistocephalus solidus]|uniref:NTP_transferase domain-containing protein n=1 Tax=Schistocephalus solidus TaxID=70667 RepID=A0A183SE84_SCHSO|nr:unnamed protein product [Schistocephalus solidus]